MTVGSRFMVILEAAPDAMLMVKQDGRIVLANAQTESLFGYTQDELLGETVEVLVPERFRGRHPGHRAGYFAPLRAPGQGSVFFAVLPRVAQAVERARAEAAELAQERAGGR